MNEPLTRTAYDFIRIEVPCPQCGQVTLQPLRKLESNDTTACPGCAAVIDTSSEKWRAAIKSAVDLYRSIRVLKQQ